MSGKDLPERLKNRFLFQTAAQCRFGQFMAGGLKSPAHGMAQVLKYFQVVSAVDGPGIFNF